MGFVLRCLTRLAEEGRSGRGWRRWAPMRVLRGLVRERGTIRGGGFPHRPLAANGSPPGSQAGEIESGTSMVAPEMVATLRGQRPKSSERSGLAAAARQRGQPMGWFAIDAPLVRLAAPSEQVLSMDEDLDPAGIPVKWRPAFAQPGAMIRWTSPPSSSVFAREDSRPFLGGSIGLSASRRPETLRFRRWPGLPLPR